MEELHMGLLTSKILVGFAALFFIVSVTGRASIYQLTPFHLVFVLVLGEFLGNALYENSVSTLQFLYGTTIWMLLMLTVEWTTQKFKKTRTLLVGNPAIVIREGIYDKEMLKRNKIEVNQVASLLRQNSVFSVREVKYGILEANGQISILLKDQHKTPTKQDMMLAVKEEDLPISFIVDGQILNDNLKDRGFSKQWLMQELKKHGYEDEKRIFYADWQADDGLHISPMQGKQQK
ncbi:DUF421 domain-containing protein [Falsibacillus albus]|uniref:DUF421 domain-containing protein n=1 Tax=Falsibacillus albus TaxID=2478915 RepID=A0A3L7JZI0_9BACI|nr:DUF421 domain-containing protein [Falsibacillus albus]RLQ96146.1 DUF421 domain-containing protein [Falsibacillus albus]